MDLKRIPLGNDIFLNILPDDRFKTNYISISFFSRLKSETAALNSLLPLVLRRGTSSYPDMKAIARKHKSLYNSSLSTTTSDFGDIQVIGFSSLVLKNEYADGCDVTSGILSFICELLRKPLLKNGAFLPEYVQREKQTLVDNINSVINNKDQFAVLRCYETVCENEPAAIRGTGTVEQVMSITPEELTAHLDRVLRSYRVEIFAVGEFDTEKLKASCSDIFNGIERTDTETVSSTLIEKRADVKRVTETQPINQGKLCLGFTAPYSSTHPDLPAYSLFSLIYANSTISKLFLNVREKMSLCYYCNALICLNKGVMRVASGIEVKNKEAAEQAILKQLDECRNGNISDEELEAAKKEAENEILSMADNVGALVSWYSSRVLSNAEYDQLDYLERIKKVTKEDIRRVAQNVTLDTVYFLEGTLLQEENDHE